MITKEFIGKFIWPIYALYLLIGSLVVRFNMLDLLYVFIFTFILIIGHILDYKTLDEE